jgi:F-type H+-transporting ATPase subunit a
MSLSHFLTLAASNPVDHVVNQPFIKTNLFGIEGLWLWSAHVGNLLLAGLLTILVIGWAASKIATGPASQGTDRFITRNPFAHMIEVICTYLRDNTVRPLLGDRTDRFIPFLWTIFFFILFSNLLGLVPILDVLHLVNSDWKKNHVAPFGSTATQNIFVTASLAIIAAVVINLAGIKELGLGGYLKHLTAGTPAYLWPLMIPIEIIGTVIKPVALALRLFANMTAGHILVAVLFMFAVKGLDMLSSGGISVVLGPVITVVSVLSAVAIYLLELFVAFLQAFVFMFLTTVFISQLSHHHDHEHDEAHGHEHAHAHAHAH